MSDIIRVMKQLPHEISEDRRSRLGGLLKSKATQATNDFLQAQHKGKKKMLVLTHYSYIYSISLSIDWGFQTPGTEKVLK